MNDDETAIVSILADLPQSTSDASRSERVRAQCHKVLERKRVTIIRAERRPLRPQHVLEFVLVGGFCVVYLCVVAVNALQTRGLL